MANTGLLAHFIRRDRKKESVASVPAWSTAVGLSVILIFSGALIYLIANRPQPLPEKLVQQSTPEATLTPIENPELYLDKEKQISFAYPKGIYQVKTDSEAEYGRVSQANIPNSFSSLKGYAPPKVIWALKVDGGKTLPKPFAVWVFENEENLSIQDWFEKYWYYPFTWGEASNEEIEKRRPVPMGLIDREQSYGYNAGSSPMGYLKYSYVMRGSKIYLFETTGEETDSLGDQILASFRFLLPEEK